jgi:NAD(P)-dependent dehydrogenase (short-subunit alcohol dehydrogenase family)
MKIAKGTKVLVTGAASGIGRAAALALARRGCRLFLTDIDAAGLNETAELARKGGAGLVMVRAFDVSRYEDMKAFADTVHAEHGSLDVLMNVAGIALFALVEDMTHAHWQKVINVNLWGPIHGIECFLPEMIKARRGHVLNVSSTAGLTGAPWHAAYSTTKWGLVGLSEVLRYDLMQHNIGVTVVCPGAVDTPIRESVEILGVDPSDPRIKRMKERFSRRAVSPADVADLMIDAVEREKFLVITSFDIKLVYFLKRCCFPLYHLVLKRISRMMNTMKRR